MIVSFLNSLWEFVQTPQVASAIISVLGLGTIAYYGHKLVRQSATENIAVAERKLFLDLIKDRAQWSKDATKHLHNLSRISLTTDCDKLVEQQAEALNDIDELFNLNVNARWLFGLHISDKHLELCQGADALYDLRRGMEWEEVAGKKVRRHNKHPDIGALEKKINSLGVIDRAISEMLTDYLFVGDINRSTLAIHKVIVPRGWLTWKERPWDSNRTDN